MGNRTRKIKVVIVSHYILLANELVNILNYDNHIEIIDTVINGEEVLRRVKRQKVDIVLTAILMSIIDVIDATEVIHKNFPDTKVLICQFIIREVVFIMLLKQE